MIKFLSNKPQIKILYGKCVFFIKGSALRNVAHDSAMDAESIVQGIMPANKKGK